MCGRYTLRAKLNLLLSQFAAEMAEAVEWEPRYNIPPTATVLAVRQNQQRRELVTLRWGLIPSWAKDAKLAQINARADTVATKPMFRAAYKKRRCLILADGYYEWLREGKEKQPFFYEVDHGQPFAMAGLWESWVPPDQPAPIESCTIITTDANELASDVHNRMPVILNPADYDAWLTGAEVPLVPFAAQRMSVRPVDRFINKAGNEGAQCLSAPLF